MGSKNKKDDREKLDDNPDNDIKLVGLKDSSAAPLTTTANGDINSTKEEYSSLRHQDVNSAHYVVGPADDDKRRGHHSLEMQLQIEGRSDEEIARIRQNRNKQLHNQVQTPITHGK